MTSCVCFGLDVGKLIYFFIETLSRDRTRSKPGLNNDLNKLKLECYNLGLQAFGFDKIQAFKLL